MDSLRDSIHQQSLEELISLDHHEINLPAGDASRSPVREKYILPAYGADPGRVDVGLGNATTQELAPVDFDEIQHPPLLALSRR